MNYQIVLIAALLLTACGSAPGEGAGSCGNSQYLGHWEDHQSSALGDQTIDVRGDCTATDSLCGDFAWVPEQVIEGSSVNVKLTVSMAKDPTSCLPAGEHHCSATRSYYGNQEQFHLSCDQNGDSWYRIFVRGTP